MMEDKEVLLNSYENDASSVDGYERWSSYESNTSRMDEYNLNLEARLFDEMEAKMTEESDLSCVAFSRAFQQQHMISSQLLQLVVDFDSPNSPDYGKTLMRERWWQCSSQEEL
ncbi:hypothetical protein Nepgr_024102 [Nepenthes gracilis]|uniref:Uncharacterized protein n=1 Tax=Nepenthes gracilis TaxID=150966 RepID=A0AAD3XZQ5_NEPGR|nr:hypothetical protein Nepgr_024102 [Nepenthes gracilis]